MADLIRDLILGQCEIKFLQREERDGRERMWLRIEKGWIINFFFKREKITNAWCYNAALNLMILM